MSCGDLIMRRPNGREGFVSILVLFSFLILVSSALLVNTCSDVYGLGSLQGLSSKATALSHQANAVWIDPAEVDISSASAGYRFNVSLWANFSVPSFAWQVKLYYDTTYLRVVRANYTGTGKSQFFDSHDTIGVNASINIEKGSMMYGETLIGSDIQAAGSGSLCWVELEIVSLTSKTQLDINNEDTFILDHDLNFIPCAKSSALVPGTSWTGIYVIGVAPSPVLVNMSARVYGGGATAGASVVALLSGKVDQSLGAGNLTLGSTIAAATGDWEISFATPNVSPGNYSVYAIDNQTSLSDMTAVQVTLEQVPLEVDSVTPSSAQLGTVVTIRGRGGIEGAIRIYFDDVEIPNNSTSIDGSWSGSFWVPNTSFGYHVIKVRDMSSQKTVTAPLFVTSGVQDKPDGDPGTQSVLSVSMINFPMSPVLLYLLAAAVVLGVGVLTVLIFLSRIRK